MAKNWVYAHTDGITYNVIDYYDTDPGNAVPPGYVADGKPRYVGWGEVVQTGRYTSARTGQTVYTILYQRQGEIDAFAGYTIMTPDQRAADYTPEQQEDLIVSIHKYIQEQSKR